MMTPKEVLNHVTAEPFRPFRINTASGRSYEIRHPEVVQVGKTTLTISVPLADTLTPKGSGIKCRCCPSNRSGPSTPRPSTSSLSRSVKLVP
jgi:hypothetical protein